MDGLTTCRVGINGSDLHPHTSGGAQPIAWIQIDSVGPSPVEHPKGMVISSGHRVCFTRAIIYRHLDQSLGAGTSDEMGDLAGPLLSGRRIGGEHPITHRHQFDGFRGSVRKQYKGSRNKTVETVRPITISITRAVPAPTGGSTTVTEESEGFEERTRNLCGPVAQVLDEGIPSEPFSSCFFELKYQHSPGHLSGPVRAASQPAQDVPVLELGDGPLPR